MTKNIKIGDMLVEVPDSNLLELPGIAHESQLVTNRPTEPSDPEPDIYVYRPNDVFQSSIDQVQAISSIERVEKPWVHKTFFVFFVVFPFVVCELIATAISAGEPGLTRVRTYVFFTVMATVCSLPYIATWRRARKRRRESLVLRDNNSLQRP